MSGSLPVSGDRIILDVGERRFITATQTLIQGSGFFSALLSDRWNGTKRDQPQQPYFIDLDGDVFADTLRYLRTGVFPLFYDKSKGHNYYLYTILLAQARYLQIPKLENWLEKNSYLQAISVTTSIEEIDLAKIEAEKRTADIDVEFHTTRRYREAYVCPRGIASHYGQPQKCGKACARAENGGWYGNGNDYGDEVDEEDYTAVTVIRKQTTFHREICMG